MSQVSEQVLSSLLAKQTLASSAGVATTDLYYSSTNSKKEIIPSTTYVGRYTQSLQSTAWGSSSQITVPSNGLVGQVYLNMQLELPPSSFVAQGWGYQCIQQISYIWGSSNTSQLTISSPSMIALLLSGCETMNEQGTELLFQGGEASSSATVGQTRTEEATIMIPLPFSTMCTDRPPFDLSLLSGSSPFIIRVDLVNDPLNVICNTFGGTPTYPVGLKTATVIFTTTEILDTSLSLSSQLRADPSLVASYPFLHTQSAPSQTFTSNAASPSGYGGPGSALQTINLTSFLRSDLVGIIFSLQDTAELRARTVGSTTVAPQFFAYTMVDFELLYNGQRLMYCPGYSNQLIGMRGRKGAAYVTQPRTSSNGLSTVSTVNQYMYQPVFYSTFNGAQSQCSPFMQPNTSRYPNQVLQVRFRTEASATVQTWILNCTYIYSALSEVDASGGVNILFS